MAKVDVAPGRIPGMIAPMAIEEEYRKSTRWLGPLFLVALAILVVVLLLGGGGASP